MTRWHKTEFDFYPVRAFQKRAGGGMTLEGGGSSESSNSTDTTQVDRRIVNDSGLVLGGDVGKFDASSTTTANGNNSNSNNVNTTTITTTDGGAVKAALDVVASGTSALTGSVNKLISGASDMFDTASANQTRGFQDLLSSSKSQSDAALGFADTGLTRSYGAFDKLVNTAADMFNNSTRAAADTSANVAKAYQTATAEKSGSLDNKTILILGVVAAGAAVLALKKG